MLIIFHFNELNFFSDSHPLSRKEAIEPLILFLRIGNNFLMKLLHMREHSARGRWKSKWQLASLIWRMGCIWVRQLACAPFCEADLQKVADFQHCSWWLPPGECNYDTTWLSFGQLSFRFVILLDYWFCWAMKKAWAKCFWEIVDFWKLEDKYRVPHRHLWCSFISHSIVLVWKSWKNGPQPEYTQRSIHPGSGLRTEPILLSSASHFLSATNR